MNLVYNMPLWAKKALEQEAKVKAENKSLEKEFEFPVKRFEGMGANRIRKRKMPVSKEFKFKLNDA